MSKIRYMVYHCMFINSWNKIHIHTKQHFVCWLTVACFLSRYLSLGDSLQSYHAHLVILYYNYGNAALIAVMYIYIFPLTDCSPLDGEGVTSN